MRRDIMRAEFSADGHILACGSQDAQSSTTDFWDFRFSRIASSVDSNYRGAFSPVAKLFAYDPTVGEVCLWNVEQHALHNRLIRCPLFSADGCVFSPDGKWLVCWNAAGWDVWYVNSGTCRYHLLTGKGTPPRISSDNKLLELVWSNRATTINIINLQCGFQHSSVTCHDELLSMDILHDGQLLATSTRWNVLKLWEMQRLPAFAARDGQP
jgi:WD40 repeat protein